MVYTDATHNIERGLLFWESFTITMPIRHLILIQIKQWYLLPHFHTIATKPNFFPITYITQEI
jgi:hypothetical protein